MENIHIISEKKTLLEALSKSTRLPRSRWSYSLLMNNSVWSGRSPMVIPVVRW